MENKEVLETLRGLRDKKIKDTTAAFEKVYNYIMDIEEQNRMLRVSNTSFKNVLAKEDDELAEFMESN